MSKEKKSLLKFVLVPTLVFVGIIVYNVLANGVFWYV